MTDQSASRYSGADVIRYAQQAIIDLRGRFDRLPDIQCANNYLLEIERRAAAVSEQQPRDDPKKEAMHIVISLLAAKANVSNETLVGMLTEAEESIKAKRWLS